MALAAALQAQPAVPAETAVSWPPGLAEAAAAQRRSLAAEQEAIRDSTLQATLGVEEAVQFDLASHACHRGPGQAWRRYGEPRLVTVDGGLARVQYPFDLFFRQALTLEEMYRKPWREGSDGEIEVRFQRDGGGWKPVAKKELLDRKGPDPGRRDGNAPHRKTVGE